MDNIANELGKIKLFKKIFHFAIYWLQNELPTTRPLVFAFQACYIKQYHLSSVLPGFTCLVMLQSYYIVIYMKNKGRIMAREEGMREKRAREEANGGVDPWFRRVETNPLK